jgi:hypothetical protein
LQSPKTAASFSFWGFQSEDAIKRWSLTQITFEEGLFVHESLGTFFEQDRAEKRFNRAPRLDLGRWGYSRSLQLTLWPEK